MFDSVQQPLGNIGKASSQGVDSQSGLTLVRREPAKTQALKRAKFKGPILIIMTQFTPINVDPNAYPSAMQRRA